MITSRHVAVSIAARFGCWALLMCVMAAATGSVQNWFPQDQCVLAYSCSLEVVSILVLLRFAPSKLTRDMIDLSFYALGFKLIKLYVYFSSPVLYDPINRYISQPILSTLFILVFIRIFWLRKTKGGLLLADWPAIGLYGWTAPPMRSAQAQTSVDDIFYTVAAFIIAALLGVASVAAPAGWEYALTAVSGVIILAAYQGKFDHALCTTVITAAERETLIEFYRSTLRDATAALKELGELGPEHATLRTKLYLIKSDLDKKPGDNDDDDQSEQDAKD
jgi:hypothetical protein